METTATPITRRRLLEAGFATAAAGALVRSPASVLAGPGLRTRPGTGAAWKIDPREFPSAHRLKTWQRQLDELGLRATGTRVHEHYIDTLHERLERAGVRHVHTDAVPFKRWTTHDRKLEIVGGSSPDP